MQLLFSLNDVGDVMVVYVKKHNRRVKKMTDEEFSEWLKKDYNWVGM